MDWEDKSKMIMMVMADNNDDDNAHTIVSLAVVLCTPKHLEKLSSWDTLN